jgi:hypothetical protein
VPGHHVGQGDATSYQSRQLDRRDWCLNRANLFDASQFPEHLASLFLFLPPHFLSFYIISPPRDGSIGDSYFPLKSYPCCALNQLYELVFQSCWVHMSSSPSHFLIF